MAKNSLPTPETLRQLLRYEAETGRLFWRKRPTKFFRTEGDARKWNNRWAGKEAFTAIGKQGAFSRVLGVNLLAHRVAWAVAFGKWPKDQIDHINRNRLDNRICNLREADAAQNGANRCRPRGASNPYRGVSAQCQKWRAAIGVRNRRVSIGTFACPTIAALAYDRAARELHGEFATTNFPLGRIK